MVEAFIPGTNQVGWWRLQHMKVDVSLVALITNYPTGGPQYVRLQSNAPDKIVSNKGAPQRTVLSTFLFTLTHSHHSLQILLTGLPPAVVFR